MALIILRCVFLAVAIALGFQLLDSDLLGRRTTSGCPGSAFSAYWPSPSACWPPMLSIRRKRLDTITAVYFGMIIGLFLTYVFLFAMGPWIAKADTSWSTSLRLALATIVCYTCISVLLQTKDDFRFIIPYVEFAKEVKGLKPYVLDTSVVIDGRIADVVETRVIDNQLIMPQFVIAELQAHRRFERQAPPQPRPPRARHPQPAAQRSEGRPRDLRPRAAGVRRPAGRSEARAAGQAPAKARSSRTTTTSTRSPSCTTSA